MVFCVLALTSCRSTPVKSQDNGAAKSSGNVIKSTDGAIIAPPPQIQVFQPGSAGGGKDHAVVAGVPDVAVFAKQVTTVGDNFSASFSPDGTQILFESRNRSAHKQSQAYELRLATMTERRVTFQDGDVTGAGYYPGGQHIIYASTTDEIKEEDVYLKSIFKTYLPGAPGPTDATSPQAPGELENLSNSDIYRQSLDGREIERLTVSRGYDGEPSIDAKGGRIIFTSNRFGVPNLFIFNSHGLNRLTDSDQPDRYGRFAPDMKAILWSRFSKDYKTAQLTLAEGSVKKAAALTGPGFTDIFPTWSPNGQDIVFSSNRGGKSFDLYTIDRLGKCLKRLTDASGDKLYPAFSPDGSKLIFTGNQSGTNQIYLMDFISPKTCLAPPKNPDTPTPPAEALGH